MSLKDKVKFKMLVDPDDPETLILKPIDCELVDGSTYTINIKDLKFNDNTTYSNKESFILAPTENYFVTVDDVNELIYSLNIPDENIIKHIIEAGKTAMYWAKRKVDNPKDVPDFNNVNLQEDYYPFYMFIKTNATVHALKEHYIEMISHPYKWRDTLSDLEREETWDFNAMKKLIDDLEKEEEEWLELVVTITADPKWALRGKYCYSTFDTYSNPHHRTLWGRSPYKNDYDRRF